MRWDKAENMDKRPSQEAHSSMKECLSTISCLDKSDKALIASTWLMRSWYWSNVSQSEIIKVSFRMQFKIFDALGFVIFYNAILISFCEHILISKNINLTNFFFFLFDVWLDGETMSRRIWLRSTPRFNQRRTFSQSDFPSNHTKMISFNRERDYFDSSSDFISAFSIKRWIRVN